MRTLAVGVLVGLVACPVTAAAQKDVFVGAFIDFHSALAGTYGDEGGVAAAALDRMIASLAAWEQAQAQTEASLKTRTGITAGELALFYAEQARFGEAISAMASAIAAEPTRASLHVFKGLLEESAGRRADAAQTFVTASTTDPDDPVAAYLAASHMPTTSELEDRQRQVAVLVRAIASRTAAKPKAPFVRYELIDDASARVPVFSPAAYADGFALFVARRFREAVASFKAGLAQDPLVADPAGGDERARAGVAALREKRGPEAIKQLQAAVAALPNSSEAHRMLGVAFRAMARLPESIRSLESAVKLSPGDERARVTLGSTLAEAGRLSDAERVLRETIQRLPKSAEARWALASVYERQNRGLEAITTLEEAAALTIVAGKAALHWRIAELAHRHQDYERVVTALTDRARLLANDGYAHKALGLAQVRIGRNDEALTELLMATMLGVEDAETLTSIGQIHLGAERFDAAETALRRGVALDAKNPQARYALGMTLTRLGKSEEARVQLEEFRKLRSAALSEQQRLFEKQK